MTTKKLVQEVLEMQAVILDKQARRFEADEKKDALIKDFVKKSSEADQILYVYTVYDKKADYCEPVACTPSDPARFLLEMRRHAMNGYLKYPEDKQLVLVGAFNDGTGKLTALDQPQVIGDLKLPEGFERKEEQHVPLSEEQPRAEG